MSVHCGRSLQAKPQLLLAASARRPERSPPESAMRNSPPITEVEIWKRSCTRPLLPKLDASRS
eukprot:6179258-Amphidinium_carterae.2